MSGAMHPKFLLGWAILAFSAVGVGVADEPAPGPGSGQRPPIYVEAPGDPPAPPPLIRHTSPPLPPAQLARGRYQSVQVNVDAHGNNILGDAANESTIAVDPTRPYRIVIGWRQFDSVQSNFREAGWAYSHDAGRTWTFAGVLQSGVFRTDPVLDADRQGNFYYHSLTVSGSDYSCQLFKSTNGGLSWGPPVPGYGGDKNWMVVDRTTGLGSGHVYAIWQRFYNCCGNLTFTRSVDGGASFQYPTFVPSSPTFGTLAVGPDGAVYAAGIEAIDYQNFDVFVVGKSTNAQNPAVSPTFVTTVVNLGGSMDFSTGPNPAGLLGQAQVAVDYSGGPTHGYVYLLCSVDPPGSDPLDVKLSRSTDGGQTWSPPVRVNNDPPGVNAWQWFGTLSVAPNGRIDVVWNDTRSSGQVNLSELYYAYSIDAGVTWSPNVPITPLWNSHVGWPNQNKIGDYYHMISDDVGANLAYAATFNGEQDVYFMRIGEYDCNGNGIPDPQDLANGTLTDLNQNGFPDQCEGLGDLNCDGVVNFADINPFVLALSGQAAYEAVYPNCNWLNADCNGDGTVNFADINPFVALLSGP